MPMIDNYQRGPGEMDLVATHQRCLIAAAMRTTGPMLELGCGWYSTPLLHEIAVAQKRLLVTVDNQEHWIQQFKAENWDIKRFGLGHTYHRLLTVGWWGDAPVFGTEWYSYAVWPREASSWGLAFIDQGQPCEREYAIRQLIDRVDVFVLHDTEEPHAYGYCRTLPMFKYQWTDKCQKAWTTIASNTIDVTGWMRELPPVEPSQEVT